jgi:hypothetical protein
MPRRWLLATSGIGLRPCAPPMGHTRSGERAASGEQPQEPGLYLTGTQWSHSGMCRFCQPRTSVDLHQRDVLAPEGEAQVHTAAEFEVAS